MKLKDSFILYFFWNIAILFSQENDVQLLGLKGALKEMRTDLYQATEKNGQLIIGNAIDSIDYHKLMCFNKRGNIVKEVLYGKDKQPSNRIIYKYDRFGNKRKSKNYCMPNNKLYEICKYEYSTVRWIGPPYGIRHRLIKKVWLSPAKKIRLICKLYYAGTDHVLKEEWNTREIVEYYVTDREYTDEEMKDYYAYSYKYNEDGQLIERWTCNPKEVIAYDSIGKELVRDTLYLKINPLQCAHFYTYNKKEEVETEIYKLQRLVRKFGDSTISITNFNYKYEYDEKGNWVKEIHYLEGKLFRVTLRSFTYG